MAVQFASLLGGLFTAATAVPKLGMAGLMIAGGALNIAGSALASVNLMGTAALMASGGLHGRGKSGNVKKDEARKSQMVKSSVNKKGPTGQGGSRGGASNSLANIKSTLADYNEPEGSMSMLPTGGEDGMGMLSGMLRQIAVNTSYLGGIDSKIGALLSLSSVPLIDQAQETKGGDGGGMGGESKQGFISKSFNSLTSGFSKISSSLGGAVKNVLKGFALLAAFITFKKFEPEITSGLASLFKNVSGFFDTMGAGVDPSAGILGYFDNMMETTILPALTTMAEKAIAVIFKGITIALNKVLPGFLQIEEGLDDSSSGTTKQTKSQIATQAISDTGADLGTVTGYGDLAGKNIGLGDYVFGGKGDVKPGLEAENVKQAVRERLQFMYDVFMKSGGRVRWTEIGKGFTYDGGIDSLNGTFDVKDILFNSKPIIDGFVKPRRKDGKYLENLPKPNLTGSNLTEYIRDSVEMSKAKQVMEYDMGILDNFLFQTPTFGEKFLPFMPENMSNKEAIKSFNDSLKKRNLLLNDDGASLKNGQGEILAAIDASNNSQHMHETNVSGLTSYTNLNVAPFMGVNQVA